MDTREWLVHFDPPVIYCIAFPLYVFVLPVLVWKGVKQLPRKLPLALVVTEEVFWIVMILSGWLCRDMFLAFRWPWELGGFKLTAVNDKNVSEIFWQQLVNTAIPEHPVVRELPGILAILSYTILAPLLFRYGKKRGLCQNWAVSVFQPLLLFFPIAILLKWSCGIKYVLAFPEVFLNL